MKKGVYRFTVQDADGGQRLDQFLAGSCDGLSRGMVRKLIDLGGVHLAGRRIRRCAQIVASGQTIEMYVDGLPLEPFLLSSEQILYQDDFLLAVNKPAGVATQPTPARFRGTLYDALQVYLTNPWQRHQKPVVGMVQRLDLDTSGVMIFSIHPRAHKNLTNAFREKRVRKIYQALVTGRIDAGQGVIKSQLARRRATNLMVSVQRGGKNAETRYRLLENLGCASLLEIEIPTGRSHQIRAHFSEQGHPLLGDTAYGGPSQINGFQVSRQMLHAHALQFEHPVTSDAMTLTAELPGDFEAVLQKLKSDG